MKREGLSETEATARVFVLDSVGLLFKGRPKMEEYKNRFCQEASTIRDWKKQGDTPTLLETVQNSKCSILLGMQEIERNRSFLPFAHISFP